MKENIAKEKLRIIDTLKENTSLVITIIGVVWIVFQFVIIPIQEMRFQINNILDNHLKTIQDQMTAATTERELQGKQLQALSEQIVRLTTILEK